MSSATPFVGDYYDILGVPRDASSEEIKKAFRKLARECHPDVAGDDPDAAARFNRVRKAYETLIDPVSRARYDRAGQRRSTIRGSWRPPGGFDFGGPGRPGGGKAQKGAWKSGANTLDLEDIFGDYGGKDDFGFGDRGGKVDGRPKAAPPPPSTPQPGRDISLHVDVEQSVAHNGGTVTLHYPRLRRGDDGLTLYRYSELYDLRVPPGTEHGQSLRVERMGDAGAHGGPYGDLVCDLRVVPDRHAPAGEHHGPGPGAGRRPGPPPPKPIDPPGARHRKVRAEARQAAEATPRPSPPGTAKPAPDPKPESGARIVPISVVEALLGGRIEVATPGGRVRVTVPPGTSSGARLRLRGKGEGGADLYVELRIVVPRELDEESRALIERFAVLNPGDPRED